jgi:hypothetical protein
VTKDGRPAEVSNWARFCYSFGVIVAIGGGLFLLDGAWQSYWQHIQSTIWPAVEARVVECTIAGSWSYSGTPNSRNVWGNSSQVRCKFDYEVHGIAHESTGSVGSSIFTAERRVYPAPKVTLTKMRDWMARHPSRSILMIHYNPKDPSDVSLAGADSELQSTLPHDRLSFGILAMVGGLVLIGIGRRM